MAGWLGKQNRCIVPATSFCEYADTNPRRFRLGARTADIVAALWPERCKALVSVSGYLIGSQEAGKAPLPPAAELQWWYQFYFATERGQIGYDKNRRDF